MEDADRFAVHALGGLLLGAATVALVQFFVPTSFWQPIVALALAVAMTALARWIDRRGDARSALTLRCASLVGAGAVPFFPIAPPPLSALAAFVAVVPLVGRATPVASALLAVPCFFVNARHATGADMLRGDDVVAELIVLAALLGFGALLVRRRAERWGGWALALHAVAIAATTLPLLDAMRVTDAGIAALAVGVALGLLFALGLRLRVRALVTTTAALLAFAAASFAFLALGPALAALVLLCMGGALVWQGEHIRSYLEAPS